MTDAEQDAITNFTALSSNGSLVPNDGLLGARSGDTWELFIAPQAEASGSSTVTLTATDARGAQRVMQFTVVVATVNDPPSFAFYSAINNPGAVAGFSDNRKVIRLSSSVMNRSRMVVRYCPMPIWWWVEPAGTPTICQQLAGCVRHRGCRRWYERSGADAQPLSA